METTAIFTISIIGEETGQSYSGQFKVKTLITRRDRLRADEIRRELIGSKPDGVSPAVVADALILSQLAVRVLESPKFWQDSQNGLDLVDGNVIGEVFRLTMDEAEKRSEALKKESEEALKKLAKT